MEPSWDPKSIKNGRKTASKNIAIFRRSWLAGQRPATLGVCLASPLAAAYMRALSSQNIRVRTKREERRGKKKERKKGRREEEGGRTRRKRKASRI